MGINKLKRVVDMLESQVEGHRKKLENLTENYLKSEYELEQLKFFSDHGTAYKIGVTYNGYTINKRVVILPFDNSKPSELKKMLQIFPTMGMGVEQVKKIFSDRHLVKSEIVYYLVTVKTKSIFGKTAWVTESKFKELVEKQNDAGSDLKKFTNSGEMPLYQCHKKVRAVKIKEILFEDNMAGAWITSDECPRFRVDAEYLIKHKPASGALYADGYYVEYEDGYKSWSPAEAFESGYTKL